MKRFRRILFATDFSKTSRPAFQTALMLATTHRANLLILHVIVPMSPVGPEEAIAWPAWEELEAQNQKWAAGQLHRLTTKARQSHARVTTRLAEGYPAQEIARTARVSRADLIVVGTHGRTGLSRLLVGSVAQRVVATTHCSVLMVRP